MKPAPSVQRAKVVAADVASATAVGAALKVGAKDHHGVKGAAVGAAGGKAQAVKPKARNTSLVTALVVVGSCVGMLVLMIYKSP